MTNAPKDKNPAYLSRLLKKLKSKKRNGLGNAIRHGYGDFSIQLPFDHMLPNYQRDHPKYDRFLPHLVKHLNASEVVVDIGANVGDTLAAMFEANPALCYICVEPDNLFFEFLLKNIERIRSAGKDINVRTIKALVGESISASSLEGKGGTKHAVASENGEIISKPLDNLLHSHEAAAVRLLKTDVDGFDYDVINSSSSVIRMSKPLIFFELQNDNENQYKNYLEMLQDLTAVGYTDWFIFDNFGSFMLKTSSVNTIEQLMSYVWNQTTGQSTRTVYYLDVLAAQKTDADLIDEVLKTY